MAATILKETWLGNRLYLKSAVQVQGTGAIANGDALATDNKKYPVGSEYIDTTAKKVYKRAAVTGVAADWVELTTSA